MINIIIAAFGVMLVIGGFYAMSFGFETPPSIGLFFIGLILTVLGAMVFFIFGGKVDLNEFKSKSKDVSKSRKKIPTKDVSKKVDIPESPRKIQPKVAKKPQDPPIKRLVTDRKDIVNEKGPSQITPKKIEPKKVSVDNTKKPVVNKTDGNKPKVIAPKKIKPVMPEKKAVEKPTAKPEMASKEIKPVPKATKEKDKPKTITERIKPSFIRKKSSSDDKVKEDEPKVAANTQEDKVKKDKPKIVMSKKVEPVKRDAEDEYVKNRLNKLKENYIKNAADIENLIEERLDSFKGTLDQIKSESKDPSIIWSFDAGDVQDTMQETILKADEKILMMYPWVRNIDVSVLKKFMETESKMILQEASLDDDASVELIKLLMENNVKIRTMPHVHTVAIVSDEDNGLIISTDPIYESFEVGVIYKDQKSIEEIERMFEEAWGLSQEIDLSLND
ncbi:MAG TPA: hypothetical protein VK426_02710 [Methanobacterium sp.]|nr:hypothetical protein [Methanobacterium sp.]